MRLWTVICLAWLLPALMVVSPSAAIGAEGFRLSAPAALAESGFLKYVLPRFSLKTGVRIKRVAEGEEAQAAFVAQGRGQQVFTGLGQTWRLRILAPDHPGVKRFAKWLTSDIGRRTISGFAPEGAPLFVPADMAQAVAETTDFTGDAKRGLRLAHENCGRCHTVSKTTRMTNIGSTPSFFILRGLPDWEGRFRSFFAINPHPAFTRIKGVREDFAIDRPPPIVPLDITLDDLEDILAYVAALEAADLGRPLERR